VPAFYTGASEGQPAGYALGYVLLFQAAGVFADRIDAGARLARALGDVPRDALVLGIPRGGVVVARAVADELGLELDIILARKLGAPANPELAIGAVGPDGSVVLDETVISMLHGVPEDYVKAEAARGVGEIRRRDALYRAGRPGLDVTGRTCVIVDDGIATGSTARAACLWARRAGATEVVLAVPVAPARGVEALGAVADRVICLHAPDEFYAVGQWYATFTQITDDEVIAALNRLAV
jgi:putative phosphoribosyl transferase